MEYKYIQLQQSLLQERIDTNKKENVIVRKQLHSFHKLYTPDVESTTFYNIPFPYKERLTLKGGSLNQMQQSSKIKIEEPGVEQIQSIVEKIPREALLENIKSIIKTNTTLKKDVAKKILSTIKSSSFYLYELGYSYFVKRKSEHSNQLLKHHINMQTTQNFNSFTSVSEEYFPQSVNNNKDELIVFFQNSRNNRETVLTASVINSITVEEPKLDCFFVLNTDKKEIVYIEYYNVHYRFQWVCKQQYGTTNYSVIDFSLKNYITKENCSLYEKAFYCSIPALQEKFMTEYFQQSINKQGLPTKFEPELFTVEAMEVLAEKSFTSKTHFVYIVMKFHYSVIITFLKMISSALTYSEAINEIKQEENVTLNKSKVELESMLRKFYAAHIALQGKANITEREQTKRNKALEVLKESAENDLRAASKKLEEQKTIINAKELSIVALEEEKKCNFLEKDKLSKEVSKLEKTVSENNTELKLLENKVVDLQKQNDENSILKEENKQIKKDRFIQVAFAGVAGKFIPLKLILTPFMWLNQESSKSTVSNMSQNVVQEIPSKQPLDKVRTFLMSQTAEYSENISKVSSWSIFVTAIISPVQAVLAIGFSYIIESNVGTPKEFLSNLVKK